MRAKEIQPGLFLIGLPGVNCFLLDSGTDGLTLIDTGNPGSGSGIREAVLSVGRHISEVKQILVTHCHPDHAGGLGELRKLTSATVFMHRRDAMLVAAGRGMRRLSPTPGPLNALLYRVLIAPKGDTVPRARADILVDHGDTIPVAGGISVIHTPGHTEGHLVFLARERGVAFVGDAAASFLGLRLMVAYEHLQQGVMSLRNLCRYEFEVACFGHGPPIRKAAAARFRQRWARGARRPQGGRTSTR